MWLKKKWGYDLAMYHLFIGHIDIGVMRQMSVSKSFSKLVTP